MFAAAYGSVSDIEILWTTLALVGAIFSSWNIYDAIADMRALGHIKNGRRLLAMSTLQSEIARFIIQIIFATIGIMAMILPETPVTANLSLTQTLLGFMIRWGLIISASLIVYKSYLAYRVRKYMRSHTLKISDD